MLKSNKIIRHYQSLATKFLLAGSLALTSFSATAASCEQIKFADVGWTDITATTALTTFMLESMGYATKTQLLSVPVTYKSLENNDIDVFLGNWMPTMEADIKPFRERGTVETVHTNLQGAKYTLAVPDYVYAAGVKSFKDIGKFAKQFKKHIYGIESGNDGNRLIQKMIDDKAFGLGKFTLIESSEAGMLTAVSRAIKRQKFIVFLGWEPHPMNASFKLKYLADGDAYFGANFGGAQVLTNTRKGFSAQCPNIGKMLKQLTFNLQLENQIMDGILNKQQKPRQAAKEWLQNNQHELEAWLKDITSKDGSPAIDAVRAALK